MVIKVIFDDNTNDLIHSHMLQFGIEFGLNGKKIKMFYRDSEDVWVVASRDFLRKSLDQSSRYNGPERRYQVPFASNFHITTFAVSDPTDISGRTHVNWRAKLNRLGFGQPRVGQLEMDAD